MSYKFYTICGDLLKLKIIKWSKIYTRQLDYRNNKYLSSFTQKFKE